MKNAGETVSRKVQDIEPSFVPPAVLEDLQSLIESARIRVAFGVNAEMMLYWNIGHKDPYGYFRLKNVLRTER